MQLKVEPPNQAVQTINKPIDQPGLLVQQWLVA